MSQFSPKLSVRAALVAFILALSVPILSFAQNANPESGVTSAPVPKPRKGGDLISQLNLTDDQISGIKAIREEQREPRRLATQRVRMAQRALDEAIYGPGLDEAAVEARARELAAAEGEVLRLRALGEARIRRILTDEQLATLRELRRQARFREERRRMKSRRDQAEFGPGERDPGARKTRSGPGQPEMSGQPPVQGAPARRPNVEQTAPPTRPQ